MPRQDNKGKGKRKGKGKGGWPFRKVEAEQQRVKTPARRIDSCRICGATYPAGESCGNTSSRAHTNRFARRGPTGKFID